MIIFCVLSFEDCGFRSFFLKVKHWTEGFLRALPLAVILMIFGVFGGARG